MQQGRKQELRQIFSDDPLLDEYFEECKLRGYFNNDSVKNIKFDYFEQSAFFALIIDGKIREFSGVHNFDYNGKRYYRAGFRATSICDKDYRPKLSSSLIKTSFNFTNLIPMQILYIEEQFGPQEFILTTNTEFSKTSKSHIMDKHFKRGREPWVKLLYSDIEYLNTKQNVWVLEKDEFINNFKRGC